jgi:hypothetical protein
MKTHNAVIYHCLACGSVVHAELEAESPQCCGQTMVKAAAETIREGDDVEAASGTDCETKPAAIKGPKKPR